MKIGTFYDIQLGTRDSTCIIMEQPAVNDKGHLEIGGVDTVELVKEFGTPVYVYDVALIRERARSFKEAFVKMESKHKFLMQVKHFHTLRWFN